jgi:hypothetical protein
MLNIFRYTYIFPRNRNSFLYYTVLFTVTRIVIMGTLFVSVVIPVHPVSTTYVLPGELFYPIGLVFQQLLRHQFLHLLF